VFPSQHRRTRRPGDEGDKSFIMKDLSRIAGKSFAIMADGTIPSTPSSGN
jgi:hypothetical protein